MDPGGDFMFQQEARTQEGLHAPYEFRGEKLSTEAAWGAWEYLADC